MQAPITWVEKFRRWKFGDLLANHENNFTKILAYDYLIASSGLKWDKRLQHHIVISNVCTMDRNPEPRHLQRGSGRSEASVAKGRTCL